MMSHMLPPTELRQSIIIFFIPSLDSMYVLSMICATKSEANGKKNTLQRPFWSPSNWHHGLPAETEGKKKNVLCENYLMKLFQYLITC